MAVKHKSSAGDLGRIGGQLLLLLLFPNLGVSVSVMKALLILTLFPNPFKLKLLWAMGPLRSEATTLTTKIFFST